MEHIVFLDRDSLSANIRKPAFEHTWVNFAASDSSDVDERLSSATIAITNKVPIRAQALAHLPALKMIAVSATGFDIVDLESCRQQGIVVSNVRGYALHSLPEHVLMLTLALRRNLLRYRSDVENGAWGRATHFCLLDHPIRDLHGSTLGIIGYGTLARGVEELALAFGMKVIIAEHKNARLVRHGRVSFHGVLRASDVITLHAPLTEDTRNMIGTAEFEMMKNDAVLINTGRGGLVDEVALADALQRGRLGGAAIDVLSKEPPREGNPLLDLHLPNLIVTPHVAWASDEAMQALADRVIDNIEAFVAGEPRNVVS
jgi:glycerate dehydrogenase